MLIKIAQTILHRLKAAFTTVPRISDWVFTLLLFFVFALISLPLGFLSNFLSVDLAEVPWPNLIIKAIVLLVVPSLAEECVFRVMMLSHKSEKSSIQKKWFLTILSLTAYVIYHPLNALTLYKAAYPTFFNLTFLLLTTYLGIICSWIYLKSGSIYPSVFMHWIVVIIWLFVFGGYNILHSGIVD